MTSQPPDAPVLPPWTPGERESFFAAIARHRRAARRVNWVSRACGFVLAFVVAVLMSPLLYAVLGLALDLVNLVVPMPNLIQSTTTAVGALIDQIDHPDTVPLSRWLYVMLLAALPGLAIMALALRTLGRVMREAMTSDARNFAAREPNPIELREQRFVNVVSEMAIAAALTPPRVLVTDGEGANAAAFGSDDAHTTIIVSTELLVAVNRAEMQGLAAHLVGSIANGDITAGTRIATLLGMFGLIARLGQSLADRDAAARFGKLLLGSLKRGSSAQDGELAMTLTNPFDRDASATPLQSAEAPGTDRIPWRTIAWMPLAGPLAISGFLGGMLCTVLLAPLLALSWRRRKYLADATAVRLTRDPNALAGGLEKMRGLAAGGAFGAWIAHLSVVPSGLIGARSIMGSSSVRMSPTPDQRLKALGIMGAQVSPRSTRRVPLLLWLALAPVGALVLGLLGMAIYLLLLVSLALSGLFTWFPAVILDAILR